MTSGHTYDTYYNWSVVPLFVGSGIALFSIFITAIVSIYDCSHFLQYIANLLFCFAKATFGDNIKKEDSNKFTFYCYKISLIHLFLLSTITCVILWLSFMSFWVSFIVNETFVCDPQLDCFVRDPSTHIVFSSEPLDDCTSYDSTNGTVVCFQFVVDLTKGFFALCFFVVAVIFCRLCVHILIWFREICSKYQKVRCNMSVILSFIMEILTFIFALIVIVLFIVSFFSNMVFQTGIIFWVYIFSFVYIGPLATIVVVGGAKKDTTRCHK